MNAPATSELLGVPLPAYVRKLRRKNHWQLDVQVDTLVENLFLTDTSLCQEALQQQRPAGRVSKGRMRTFLQQATAERCRSVTQEGECQVPGCPPEESDGS